MKQLVKTETRQLRKDSSELLKACEAITARDRKNKSISIGNDVYFGHMPAQKLAEYYVAMKELKGNEKCDDKTRAFAKKVVERIDFEMDKSARIERRKEFAAHGQKELA
jgi:hypothetical protein